MKGPTPGHRGMVALRFTHDSERPRIKCDPEGAAIRIFEFQPASRSLA